MNEKETKVQPELSEFEKTAEIAMQAMMNTKRSENEGFIFITTRDLGDSMRTSSGIVGKGINIKRILLQACKNNPDFKDLMLSVAAEIITDKILSEW